VNAEKWARRNGLDPFIVQDFESKYGQLPETRDQVLIYAKHAWPYTWKEYLLPDVFKTTRPETKAAVSGQAAGVGTGHAVTVKVGRG
jgi:hypothetical protein